MAKYRLRPEQFDAWRWLPGSKPEDAPDWVNARVEHWRDEDDELGPEYVGRNGVLLTSLDERIVVNPGDWFVRGPYEYVSAYSDDAFIQMFKLHKEDE